MQLPRTPHLTRRDVLRFAGLGAVGLAAVACGGGSGGAPASGGATGTAAAGQFGELAVQLSWIKNFEFAGEYFADSKGYFTEAGFSSVALVAGPVASAEAQVIQKNVHVGLSAPDATARYIVEQGAPITIIGATYQKNPFCILSIEEGTPIRTVGDLVGKTLGIQAGTNQSIFAGLLAANGIDPASVNQVVVQYDPAPLTEKKVDGFMSFLTNEPFLVKHKGFTPVTLPFADNGLPFVSETFVVLQETIDTQREMLKAFLKAEIRGWTDAVRDPEGAAKLAVEVYGKDQNLDLASEIEQATAQVDLVRSPDTDANGLFTITEELQDRGIAALGAIGITITKEELFDMSLLDEVYAENPELKAAAQ